MRRLPGWKGHASHFTCQHRVPNLWHDQKTRILKTRSGMPRRTSAALAPTAFFASVERRRGHAAHSSRLRRYARAAAVVPPTRPRRATAARLSGRMASHRLGLRAHLR